MTITELHEEVFLYLMEKRRTMPDLYFTTNELEKIEQGYIFGGNDGWIIFSFWTGYDTVAKVYRASILINLKGEFFLRFSAKDLEEFAQGFQKILENSKQFIFTQYDKNGVKENQWHSQFNTTKTWKENLDFFLEKYFIKFSENLYNYTDHAITPINRQMVPSFDRSKILTYLDKLYLQKAYQENIKQSFESPIKLTQIRLNNIGHFSEIEIDLSKRVTILIGENGSGKSTILRAIALGITGTSIFQKFRKPLLTDADLTNWLKILSIEPNGKTEFEKEGSITLTYQIGNESVFNQLVLQKEDKIQKPLVTELANYYDKHLLHLHSFKTLISLNAFDRKEAFLKNLIIGLPQGGGRNESSEAELENYADPFALLGLIRNERIDKLKGIKEWIDLYHYRYLESDKQKTDYLNAIHHLFRLISKIVSNNQDETVFQFVALLRNDKNEPQVIVKNKDQAEIFLELISEGYQNLFYWLGNILMYLYRYKEYVLQLQKDWTLDIREIPAIVIIDEIDTYLHPNWQANILKVLVEEFDKIQFVVTTHSELVLSSVENAQIYFIENGSAVQITDTYGLDSNSILRDKMNSYIRSPKVQELLNEIFEHIENGELDTAEEKLAFFANKPQMSDVLQARFRLRQKRKAHETHQ